MLALFQDVTNLDTTGLIDTGLAITPYNAAAFGALVVVLSVAVVMLWKKLAKQEADYKELAKEVVEVLAKVSLRLEDTKNDGEAIKEIKLILTQIEKKLNG